MAKRASTAKGRKSRAPARKRSAAAAPPPFAESVASGITAVESAQDDLAERVRAAVRGSLKDPRQTTADVLTLAGRFAAEGIEVARSLGSDGLSSARSIVKGVVLGISDAGGDVATATSGAVRGAVDTAVSAGEEAVAVTQRAAQGAAEAAVAAGADASANIQTAFGAATNAMLGFGLAAAEMAEKLTSVILERLAARPEPAPAARPVRQGPRGPARKKPARKKTATKKAARTRGRRA
jgi:hypothetical protein